jgi:hypothetical protein
LGKKLRKILRIFSGRLTRLPATPMTFLESLIRSIIMSIPRTDRELVSWSTNADTRLTAAPDLYGITPAVAQQYNAVHTAFVLAYNEHMAARQSGVRSSPLASTTARCKRDLLIFARGLYKAIQSNPVVSDADKILLGVHIISDTRTRTPAPDVAPGIQVLAVDGRCVRIRIYDPAQPGRKRMPDGVSNATIMSFVGPAAPTDPFAYKFEGGTTRCNLEVRFPDSVAPGSQVWLIAFFSNGRDRTGPVCTPVGAIINYGGTLLVG